QALALDDDVAEARPRRDAELGRITRALRGAAHQVLVRGEARLALGLAGARRGPHPLELLLELALPGTLLLLFLLEALLFLLEPGRVVALERVAAPAIELEDPLRRVIEEVAI